MIGFFPVSPLPVRYQSHVVPCRAVQIGPVGQEIALDADLPQYIIRGSEEAAFWRSSHPEGYKLHHTVDVAIGATPLHNAAQNGGVDDVKRLLTVKVQHVNIRDANGWAPLHVGLLRLSMGFLLHCF